MADAVRGIQGEAVTFAEPNWIYTTDATSNDPQVTGGSLWGMTGTYGSQASVAWANNKTDCSAVYVGIIDEGMQVATVDADNRVKLKTVKISRDLGASVDVSTGISDKDRLIDNPADALQDGDEVRVSSR